MSQSGSNPGPTRIFAACLRDALDDLVEHFFFDVKPRAGAAALAVIEEDRAGRAGNGGIQIRVVQNNVGRFAAQFQRNFFQIARCGLQDQLAHFGRAGERDFVDVRMRRQAPRRRFRRIPGQYSPRHPGIPLPESTRPAAAPSAASAPRASARRCNPSPAPAPASTPPSAAENSTE